jgi:hypothetical protein
VIDIPRLKLAAVSFRVLTSEPLHGDSDAAGAGQGSARSSWRWAEQALRVAYARGGLLQEGVDLSMSRPVCVATTLLVAAGGGVIDGQHAQNSFVLAPPYALIDAHIRLVGRRRHGDQLKDEFDGHHDVVLSSKCTWLHGDGYSQVLCPIMDADTCTAVQNSTLQVRYSGLMRQALAGLSIDSLRFEAEAQIPRLARVLADLRRRPEGGGNRRYGVVAHVARRDQLTAVQTEVWLRFHLARGFKVFFYDRAGFHR